MRQFIRYPVDIPIEIGLAPDTGFVQRSTRNVSIGGLAFFSDMATMPKTVIAMRIPYLRPLFEVTAGRVAWCHHEGGKLFVGVRFFFSAEAYELRMIEQLKHIENYRRYIEQREGRRLADEDAIKDWVGRHAASLPRQ